MPVNIGRIQHGDLSPPHPPDILRLIAYGRSSRGLLQDGIPGFQGGDTGGPSISHHIQCAGERSGLTLGIVDFRESGQAGRVRTGRKTPKRPILRI